MEDRLDYLLDHVPCSLGNNHLIDVPCLIQAPKHCLQILVISTEALFRFTSNNIDMSLRFHFFCLSRFLIYFPQQMAFLFTIYPSLILTYAGQTAYLIRNPNDHDDGFYKFIPKSIYWPIFVVSTLAAIVASQSLISATFSVIKQSVVLDYFPRVKVVHTSTNKEGEVYSPEVNYILMVLCVAVILIFGDGKEIGNAFGTLILKALCVTVGKLTFSSTSYTGIFYNFLTIATTLFQVLLSV